MKKISTLLILFIAIASNASAQTVTIGTQVWMTKNLDVITFRNGDPIPHAKTAEQWKKVGKKKQPAWCYYNNDSTNGAKYGKLYNWYAVNDPRGLAPVGYHIPTDAEWVSLSDHLGQDVAKKLKDTIGWNGDRDLINENGFLSLVTPEEEKIKNGNGTNESGFSGLPGGWRNENGENAWLGWHGVWWSSTDNDKSNSLGGDFHLGYDGGAGSYYIFPIGGSKAYGLSVRCIKD